MVTKWKEHGSRQVALRLMSQYGTFADAVFELVDNPVDYRFGRKVSIDIRVDKANDLIVVQDTGGEGMDDAGIGDWLNWGSGHPHVASDIGRYHVGGKSAAGSLGKSVKIISRKSGTADIWVFDDPEWGSRDDWGDYGVARRLSNHNRLPKSLRGLAERTGFVRVEIGELHAGKRFRKDDLRFRLASTYRQLLADGDVMITLDGEAVLPLELPESTAFEPVEIDEKLPTTGRLHGRIWRLDRDALADKTAGGQVRGGVRCLYNKRLIRDQEWFGYNAEGKGLLASLTGEIDVSFVAPTNDKTDFDRDSVGWGEVEEAMKRILQPIISKLRSAGGGRVSREEKKLAAEVTRDLQKIVKAMAASDNGVSSGLDGKARDGRRPPSDQGGSVSTLSSPPKRKNEARTPAPPDAVGKLERIVREARRGGSTVPPIRIEPLEKGLRSGRGKDESGGEYIVVNNEHAMYRELDAASIYVAETAVLELLRPDDDPERGGPADAEDYFREALTLVNNYVRLKDMNS